MQEKIFNNTYGTGSILATYFTDDVCIGSIVANDALFGVAVASYDLKLEPLASAPDQRDTHQQLSTPLPARAKLVLMLTVWT
jgi:hypothetical protein